MTLRTLKSSTACSTKPRAREAGRTWSRKISTESCSGHQGTLEHDQREATQHHICRMWATNPQRHLREEAAAGKDARSKEGKDYPASQRAPSPLSVELMGPSAVIGWPAAPRAEASKQILSGSPLCV